MKNKIKFKKLLIKSLLIIILFLISFLIIDNYEYKTYIKNYNIKINQIVEKIKEKNINITDKEIIEIINSNKNDNNFLSKFGIDINNDSAIINNEKNHKIFVIIDISLIIVLLIILIGIYIKYELNKDKELKEITNYLKELNKGNYKINIDSLSEDELSILRKEIYKVTVMLKTKSLNSLNDKIEIKKSIEDISHQLKTPLTSILIMLNNIIDDEEMDKNVRLEFLRDIKKEITRINVLIQTLLKLSKFDSNSIDFIKKEYYVSYIISKSIKNVSSLLDLKNIKININGNKNIKLNCDLMWEIEALTNIIKNSIEHSYDNNKIDIYYNNKKTYIEIKIKDYGSGINKKDLPHIFERFYKTKNSNGFGIGLSLSKSIIEKDNGKIYVESNKLGTTFIIKYF